MGMGGGGGKSTTTETKEVKLPWWVEQQAQSNLARANEVANRPYQENPYQKVAPLDAMAYNARKHVAGLDDYFGDYGKASTALEGLLSYNPADIKASTVGVRSLAGTDLTPYMNPFTQEVEQRGLQALASETNRGQTKLAQDATRANAFGGTRQAVQQGVALGESSRAAGDLSAQLREKNFTQAQAAAVGDIQREYEAAVKRGDWAQAAQIASVDADLKAHGQTIEAAGQMQKNADAAQAARMNQIATELGVGQVFQDQAQREADLKASKWQKKWDYPLETLNILLASLGMTPYGHTETGTSTTKQSGGGGGMGEALGAGMGLLKLFMSDVQAKTNIEPAGADPATGLPLYAYDYKADVVAAKKAKRAMGPKRVGPMAQDVARKYPQAVRTLKGGRKVIDLTRF